MIQPFSSGDPSADRQAAPPHTSSQGPQWLPKLLLALLILASVVTNLAWLRQNIVVFGHDASGHLARTLKVADILASGKTGAWMAALTVTDFRPSGLYMAVQPFYWAFGRSEDSAQLVNVVALALILLMTFVWARFLLGEWLGLLAAAITALLPMMVAMGRLFYTETLLTLLLLSGLFCLMQSKGFSRRGWTLAWGVTLGLGMLVKWTLPIYVILPLLAELWRVAIWQRPAAPPPSSRRRLLSAAALATLVATVLTVMVYWPNRMLWAQSILGPGLGVAWWLLFWLAAWLILLPATVRTNLAAALALGGAIASLWYFPQAQFVAELSDVAWGTGAGDYRGLAAVNLSHYWRYPRLFFQHHLGLSVTVVVVVVGLAPWLRVRRLWLVQWPAALTLWLSALSPFLLLTFTSQSSSRNLVAILPLLALLISLGLSAYPKRWRVAIAALWIVVLFAQWAVVSFDGLGGLRRATAVLWVEDAYAVPPSSGLTDPGYWIVPDVLATIEAHTPISTTLGVLLDTVPLHSGSFGFATELAHLPIDIETLTYNSTNGLYKVIPYQWVLLKDGSQEELQDAARGVATAILDGAPWFHQLYTLAKSYPLPSGDTAYLYWRPVGSPDPRQFSTIIYQDVPAIAATVAAWWSPAATLAFATPDEAVWLGTQPLPALAPIIPKPGKTLQWRDLEQAGDVILVVSRYDTPALQAELARHARTVQEFSAGEFTVTMLARPTRPLTAVTATAQWPGMQLRQVDLWADVTAGDVIPLDMSFTGDVNGARKVSARLVDPAGTVVFQQDALVEPSVKLTLFVPANAAPGQYRLHLLVYDSATLLPVPDLDGVEEPGVATVAVRVGP